MADKCRKTGTHTQAKMKTNWLQLTSIHFIVMQSVAGGENIAMEKLFQDGKSIHIQNT